MKISVKYTLLLIVIFSFILVQSAFTMKPDKPKKTGLMDEPYWKIFQEGTDQTVKWIDAENPRFAIYDSDTPGDETDDIVLDKETGLVWERYPSTTALNWYLSCTQCYKMELGGRKGWRLPTLEELYSLVHLNDGTPKLPYGHPFINIQPQSYWSATLHSYDFAINNRPERAWFVNFGNGDANVYERNSSEPFVWCVRGGTGHIGY